MIQKVRPGEEIDPKVLINYLYEQKLIDNKAMSMEISQFSNGYSNLTYLLDLYQQSFVLRRPPKGAVKRGHDMSREYKVLSHLQNGFDKSPQVFSYCDDESLIGSSFYLMEKIEGLIITLPTAIKRKISPTQFKDISKQWLDTFVELHQLDYVALGLQDLGRPDGYVVRQVTNWSKQYVKAATQDLPEAIKIMAWISEHQPKEYEHAFIHNDYKYDNVVFKDDSWQELVSILDWEMCTIGDPLMDLGTSLAYWMQDSDGLICKMFPSPTMLPGNMSREDLVQAYATKTGKNVDHILFYYVFGLFKIAVIVQQIFYRYQKGLTSNKKFAQLDKVCHLLCKMGCGAIEKRKII